MKIFQIQMKLKKNIMNKKKIEKITKQKNFIKEKELIKKIIQKKKVK